MTKIVIFVIQPIYDKAVVRQMREIFTRHSCPEEGVCDKEVRVEERGQMRQI